MTKTSKNATLLTSVSVLKMADPMSSCRGEQQMTKTSRKATLLTSVSVLKMAASMSS